MKGLLLKDWYVIRKSCKINLLLTLVFGGFCLIGGAISPIHFGGILFCGIFSGLLASTTYGIDEQSRFLSYYDTMPVSRCMYVSEKYVLALLTNGGALLYSALLLGINTHILGNVDASLFPVILLLIAGAGLIPHSLLMPFLFLLGVEKGRIWYILVVGLLSSVIGSVPALHSIGMGTLQVPGSLILLVCAGAMLLLYGISWVLSAVLYKRREL